MQKREAIKINPGNTKMVAHRGLSGLETENTCPAFVAAGNREEYFGIETDTHQTADGKFVVIHDRTTGRVAEEDIDVEASLFEDVRKVRLHFKDGSERIDMRIPTLEEYLEICAAYGKVPVLELKQVFSPEASKEMVETCDRIVGLDNIIFISFHFDALVNVRACAANANVQFLTNKEIDEELIARLKAHDFDLDIYYHCLTKEWVDRLHAEGIVINCWTCDDPEAAEKLVSWGVDQITSNILY